MWRRREQREVTCIACGETVPREEAREYDKQGDRWDREEKTFEHLCKPCYRDLSNQRRRELEATLVDVGAGTVSTREFLRRYDEEVSGSEEGEREH